MEIGHIKSLAARSVSYESLQVGMLIETLLGTFKCAQCTRDTTALMTDVSDNSAIAQVAHTDSKLGCF